MSKTSLITAIAYLAVGCLCIGGSIALALTHSTDLVSKYMLLTYGAWIMGFGLFIFFTEKKQ